MTQVWRRSSALLGLLLALAVPLSGCAGQRSAPPAAAAGSGTVGAPPTTGAAATISAAGSAAAAVPSAPAFPSGVSAAPVPAAPSVPAVPQPVDRAGALPGPQRVQAAPARFGQPIRYGDGLALSIVRVEQQTITATGAGAMTGSPSTLLSLRLGNGTSAALDLSGVVVTTTYGPGTSAPPVYDGTIADFAGVLAPGATTTATYAFSIPTDALDRVTTNLDIDGRHGLAVFTGSAR